MEPTDTPTPTLTPTPRWEWVTPTPMDLPELDPDEHFTIESPHEFFVDMTEMGVQNWAMLNQDGAIDGLTWILIVAIVLLGMRNIIVMIREL